MDFKPYREKHITEFAPFVDGDDLSGVRINAEDVEAGSPRSGDMIGRDPANNANMWLVAAAYFAENFEEVI
jgi:hypothetical protein